MVEVPTAESMFLVPQARSRKRPQRGDLFRIVLKNGWVFYGHVIRNDAAAFGPSRIANLVCIYADRFGLDEVPDSRRFSIDRLVIPPKATNRLPWSRGWWQTVAHDDAEELGLPETFCFKAPWRKDSYTDALGNTLSEPFEPQTGTRLGISSYASIDRAMCRALGLPVVD